jgi:hypothetical protein
MAENIPYLEERREMIRRIAGLDQPNWRMPKDRLDKDRLDRA